MRIFGETRSERRPTKNTIGKAKIFDMMFYFYQTDFPTSGSSLNSSAIIQMQKLLYYRFAVFRDGIKPISDTSNAESYLQALQAYFSIEKSYSQKDFLL